MWNLGWMKEHNIHVFYPNLWETLKLIFKRPQIDYQCEEDITCYWVSGGTGGSYYPLKNEIMVCPRNSTEEEIIHIIKHEITHLKHEQDVQGMTHEEKEEYIQARGQSD